MLAGLRPESLGPRASFAVERRARRERGDWGTLVATATRLRVSLRVVLARDRRAGVVAERWRLARALRDLGWSLPRIGRALGRHHTAVLDMVRP